VLVCQEGTQQLIEHHDKKVQRLSFRALRRELVRTSHISMHILRFLQPPVSSTSKFLALRVNCNLKLDCISGALIHSAEPGDLVVETLRADRWNAILLLFRRHSCFKISWSMMSGSWSSCIAGLPRDYAARHEPDELFIRTKMSSTSFNNSPRTLKHVTSNPYHRSLHLGRGYAL
jgi:hypothetical protein